MGGVRQILASLRSSPNVSPYLNPVKTGVDTAQKDIEFRLARYGSNRKKETPPKSIVSMVSDFSYKKNRSQSNSTMTS